MFSSTVNKYSFMTSVHLNDIKVTIMFKHQFSKSLCKAAETKIVLTNQRPKCSNKWSRHMRAHTHMHTHTHTHTYTCTHTLTHIHTHTHTHTLTHTYIYAHTLTHIYTHTHTHTHAPKQTCRHAHQL